MSWQVGGRTKSAEVGASGWLADPEAWARARWATRARDSSLGRTTLRSGVEEERSPSGCSASRRAVDLLPCA